MSETTETAPISVGFGAAFERLQAITAELGTEDTLAPDRMIALLREGAGLERALREHLDRVEQEVRSIEAGEGAQAFRIVDGEGPAPAEPVPAPVTTPASDAPAAPTAAASTARPASAPRSAATVAPTPDPVPAPPSDDDGSDWGGEPVPPLDAGPDGGWAEEPTWDDGPPAAPSPPSRGPAGRPAAPPAGRRPLPPPPTDDELPF